MMSRLPFELRLMIHLALVAYGAALAIAMSWKAMRARRAGESYVFGGWEVGAFLRGRRITPRSAHLGAVVPASFAAVLTWGLVTGRWPKPDLIFEIPSGWLDVSSDAPPGNYERIPAALRARVRETAGGVKRYAIQIDGADVERVGFASWGAGYLHGEGVVTEESTRDLAHRSLVSAGAGGAVIEAVDVRAVGSLRLGRAVVDVESLGLRLYFYAFARDRTLALMSCSMPRTMAGRLEPICDATAESTARRNAR